MRLIITGCGRSGTGFLSRVLTDSGLRCGHENVFTERGVRPWGNLRADSSWYAVASLDSIPAADRVVHLIRHPLDCARSFLGIGFFQRPPSPERRPRHGVIDRVDPSILRQPTELDRFIRYWTRWNGLVVPRAHKTLRLEDVDASAVESILSTMAVGAPSNLDAIVTQRRHYNARPRASLTLQQLRRSPLFDELRQHAQAHYDLR